MTVFATLIGASSRKPVWLTSFTSHGPPGAPNCAKRRRDELDAAVGLVAHAPEHRELHRAAEAVAVLQYGIGDLLFLAQEAGDLGEADDGIDRARGGGALAAARERLELRIDLRRELGQEAQLLGALGRAVRQRLRA